MNRKLKQELSRTWASMCGLKRSHASKVDAETFIAERKIKNQVPYQCPHCNMWHLGHSPSFRTKYLLSKLKGKKFHDPRKQGTPSGEEEPASASSCCSNS